MEERKKILIVDDERFNLKILSELLKPTYKIFIAESGEKALEIIKSTYTPDLILLDIMMPGMNGFEVCSALKGDSRYSDIPVIFISSLDAPADKINAFEEGGVDYITKPFQTKEVIARVNTHMTLRSMQKNLTKELKKERQWHEEHYKDILFIKRLHERLFPSDFSWLKRTRVHMKYIPMATGSGDYMDIRPYGENKALIFCVDVSGHGIPAMFGCIALKAYLSSASIGLSPDKIIEEAENVLLETLPDEFYATAFCGIYNESDKTLDYALAACPFPYILSPLGKSRLLKGNGLALCMKGEMKRECHKVTIEDNEVLIVHSDGLINSSYTLFESLDDFFKLNDESGKFFKDISKLVTKILDTAMELAPGHAFSDDLSILAIGHDYSPIESEVLQSLQNKKILAYVDDNDTILQLEQNLIDQECEVIIYRDSSNCVSDIIEKNPDVVLNDVDICGKNGLKVLNILRETNPKLPIIMMSDNNTTENIKACLSKNAAGYLRKPLKKYVLIKAIQNALSINLEKEIIYFDNVSLDWMDFVISSSSSVLDILERYLLLLERQPIPNHVLEDILYCIKEIGRNAIEWGNLHKPDFKVRVSTVILSDRVMVKIADEGTGFNVKKSILQMDMIEEKQLEREKQGKRDGGFGLLIVQGKMDSLKFNDRGNVVLMTKMF